MANVNAKIDLTQPKRYQDVFANVTTFHAKEAVDIFVLEKIMVLANVVNVIATLGGLVKLATA